MIYKPTLRSSPQEEDTKSFNNLANDSPWESPPISPATKFVTAFLSQSAVVWGFCNTITFSLKLAVLDVCYRRNMTWGKSAEVK